MNRSIKKIFIKFSLTKKLGGYKGTSTFFNFLYDFIDAVHGLDLEYIDMSFT